MIRWALSLLRAPFAYPLLSSDRRWIGGRCVLARVEPAELDDAGGFSVGSRKVTFYECTDSAPVCVEGIDVAHCQGEIDWRNVAASGKLFAFVRATEGASLVDALFDHNWRSSKQAGLLRGAYHSFRPREDALNQAKLFLARLDSRGELPVALDVETGNGLAYEDVAAGIAVWVTYVRANYGRPLIYASPGLWSSLPQLSTEAAADLWVADWETPSPGNVRGWGNWSFWQYSNSVAEAGITGSVNLTRFNGDLDALYAYLTRGEETRTPTATDLEQSLDTVEGVQQALNRLGWTPPLTIDGLLGRKTREALQALQGACGLEAHGALTQDTLMRIQERLARPRG